MRAAPELVSQIRALGCKQTDFAIAAEREVIVLKGCKPPGRDGRGRPFAAEWLDYTDTPETERMRAEMREVNTWLLSADIQYAECDTGVDTGASGRSLRRVFNNGTFEEGGRLAGGSWSNMSMSTGTGRPWRGHIRIEAEPIVALDFASMFVRLLYVKAGEQPPGGDLYAGIEGFGPEHRAGVKRIISAMLFKEGELMRCPQDTRLLMPKGMHIRTAAKNIKARHAPVAHLFGTAIGMSLFKLESNILLEVLRQCRAAAITALPVHDAILVAESRAVDAKGVMLSAFKAVTGFNGVVGEPKRPVPGAAELETMQMPDDVRNLMEDDPYEWARIKSVAKESREVAAEYIMRFEERNRAVEDAATLDAVGDLM